MAISPAEKKQVNTDFWAAGFAQSYGGALLSPSQFNQLFTGIVVEAVDDILRKQGIKEARPQQREQLNQFVGQAWYFASAGAVVGSQGGDAIARANYQHARARIHGIDMTYPPNKAKALRAGIMQHISDNWPHDHYPLPTQMLEAVLDTDAPAPPATTTPLQPLQRLNRFALIDNVAKGDLARGMKDRAAIEESCEHASLAWLGKSTIGILSTVLPGRAVSPEAVNDLTTAYTASIVAARWFAQSGNNPDDLAGAIAVRRAEMSGRLLPGHFSGDELEKLAAVFYERARIGGGGVPAVPAAKAAELKKFVYTATGAPEPVAPPSGQPKPPRGSGSKQKRKPN